MRGQTTAAVGNNDSFAQLWNPSGARRIKVVEVFWGMFGNFDTGVAPRITLRRSTARGATPNNTATPSTGNSEENDAAPSSAAVLEMGPFGTDPTYATPDLMTLMADQSGSGTNHQPCALLPIPRGIIVPPGSGLCVVFSIATGSYPNTETSMVFED